MDKQKVISSLFWKSLERGGAQIIQLVVQIVLARMLQPEVYGSIALLLVFISVAQVLVQSGLGTALVQNKEVNEIDFSSVFYISLGLAVLSYLLLFIAAPHIAGFYNNATLGPVLRVLGVVLFFGAINSVQNAYISRNMLFKEQFKRSLSAILISGVAGIVSAYSGLGIWALVVQQITHYVSYTIILWITIKWRPVLEFSFIRLKRLFSFGNKLLVSALIDTLYREIRTLIIGKVYTMSMLGFYNKGEQLPKIVMSNIDGSIQAVMLPALSAHQDERSKVKSMMRRAIMSSCFLVFPVMIGLAVTAEPLVKLLLTEKWLPSVPYLQVFCFSFMLWPFHTANLQAINALGRSDIFLKLELIKKCVGIAVLVISVPMGVMAIAVSSVISGVISSIINAWPNKKLLDYSYVEQVLDVLPSLGVSLLMALVVWLISLTGMHTGLLLIIQIVTGIFSYILFASLFKLEPLYYTKNLLIEIRKSRNGK